MQSEDVTQASTSSWPRWRLTGIGMLRISFGVARAVDCGSRGAAGFHPRFHELPHGCARRVAPLGQGLNRVLDRHRESQPERPHLCRRGR